VAKAANDFMVQHSAKQTQYDIVKGATNKAIAELLRKKAVENT
jgi:hypothetical protein